MTKNSPRSQSCISVALGEYLGGLVRRRYSPKTIDVYQRALLDFAEFTNARGIGEVRNVTEKHIEGYRRSLFDRGFQPASVTTYMRGVRSLFKHLVSAGLIFTDPTACMERVSEKRRIQYIPAEADVRQLLAQPDTSTKVGIRDRALLEMLYSTGARREELVRLKVPDVDIENGTVRLMGKGSRERVVPLGSEAARCLKRYIQESRPAFGVNGETAALWISMFGKPLGYQGPAVILRKYVMKAGLDLRLSPHSLRRACATHMLQRGAHPVEIQMLLGHASLTHLSQYLRVGMSELQKIHAASNPGR